MTETNMNQYDETVYHLCVTCGELKPERKFEVGDCTCKDCYDAGDSSPIFTENPDGDGWVVR